MVLKNNGCGNCSKKSSRRRKVSRGAAAEAEVGRLLVNLLPDGCLVLNDVPFAYGNLDHLVIRPDLTVCLIETKSYRGRVTWDGKQLLINKRPFSSNPICQINRSIRWVRRMARQFFGQNPWIVAVLVFPNAQVSISGAVKRIHVMPAKDLLSFIRSYSMGRQSRTILRRQARSPMPFRRQNGAGIGSG